MPKTNWTLVGDEAVRSIWVSNGLPEPEGTIWVPISETTKRIETIIPWLNKWASMPLLKNTTLLAVGGGVLTDMAGLSAALYMRGIDWHAWPTTLLAQVDAGIGGKTGVNLGAGKNLLGTFHPPKKLVVCRSFLNTLEQRHIASGYWEVLKMALIFGNQERAEHILNEHFPLKDTLIQAICSKIEIVNKDFLETGERRLLNLGHTIGHAVETASDYQLLHGEAVGFGILAACFLSKNTGLPSFPKIFLQRIIQRLIPLAHLLPPWEACLEQLYLDKKGISNTCNSNKILIHCILPCPNRMAVQSLLPPESWRLAYNQLLTVFS